MTLRFNKYFSGLSGLGKLQIDPGNNTIYTLQAYEYIGGDKSNKNREN
jgi:hypothetical protein